MDFDFQVNPKDTAVPKFFMKAIQNNFESERQGRAIFVDVEWVEIRNPGDNKSVYSNKVSDVERKRFPLQYRAFKEGNEEPVVGTPLREWPMMTPAKVEDFISRGFKTVEQLANANEDVLVHGDREWQVKAQAYLKSASGSAELQKVKVDLLRKDQEIETLKAEIKRLAGLISQRRDGSEMPVTIMDLDNIPVKAKRTRKPKVSE